MREGGLSFGQQAAILTSSVRFAASRATGVGPVTATAAKGHPLSLQHEGDRTVVRGDHLHVGAEDALLDTGTEAAQLDARALVEGFGDLAGRSGVPRRPASLAGVAVERELADDEQRRADVRGRPLLAQQAE